MPCRRLMREQGNDERLAETRGAARENALAPPVRVIVGEWIKPHCPSRRAERADEAEETPHDAMGELDVAQARDGELHPLVRPRVDAYGPEIPVLHRELGRKAAIDGQSIEVAIVKELFHPRPARPLAVLEVSLSDGVEPRRRSGVGGGSTHQTLATGHDSRIGREVEGIG